MGVTKQSNEVTEKPSDGKKWKGLKILKIEKIKNKSNLQILFIINLLITEQWKELHEYMYRLWVLCLNSRLCNIFSRHKDMRLKAWGIMASVKEWKCKGFLSFLAQLRFDYRDSYTNDDNRETSNLLTAS